MNIIEKFRLFNVKQQVKDAINHNSERELLEVLKNNSFLFLDLVERRAEDTPIFREIPFGDFRCDFLWYDCSSFGTHCVLVEVESPSSKVFTKYEPRPSAKLTKGLSQIDNWRQYLNSLSIAERQKLFGNIADFKYVLVSGTSEEWDKEAAKKWRANYNAKSSDTLIRTCNVFLRAIERYLDPYESKYCFEKYPRTLSYTELKDYIRDCPYL